MAYLVNIIIPAGTTTFKIPNDWNNGSNQVQTLGNGGNSSVQFDTGIPFYSGFSGAGAAFASKTNLAFNPNQTVSVRVGAAGSGIDTVFNGTTLASCSVGAQAGQPNAGLGGQASASVGDVKFSGGNGVNFGSSVGGCTSGGGAAGPNGPGSNGNGAGANSSVVGGAADNGTVPGGAANGGNGLSGTEFDATHGCGSGGGATDPTSGILAGNGGNYGGGAGAASQFHGTAQGLGGAGFLMVSYNPISPAANMIGL